MRIGVIILFACISLLIACGRDIPKQGYQVSVINGNEVSDPLCDAPGVYSLRLKVRYASGLLKYFNATVVFISQSQFLTNLHVMNDRYSHKHGIGRVGSIEITDFSGTTVVRLEADKEGKFSGFKLVTFDGGEDLVLVRLISAVPIQKLSHGVARPTSARIAPRGLLYLVGSGISDFRLMDLDDRTVDRNQHNSGRLRYGFVKNWRQMNATEIVYSGVFRSATELNQRGQDVSSGPGDSGGGLFSLDSDGRPLDLVALNRSGEIRDEEGLAKSYAISLWDDKISAFLNSN